MSLLVSNTYVPSVDRIGDVVFVEPSPSSPSGSSGFPDPVAGVITLAANTAYRLTGNIDIGNNRIFMEDGSAIEATGVDGGKLTGTLVGQPLLTLEGRAALRNIDIYASVSSTFVNANTTAFQTGKNLFIDGCFIRDFNSLGELGNYEVFATYRTQFSGYTNGFIIKNILGFFYADSLQFILNTGQTFMQLHSSAVVVGAVAFHACIINNQASAYLIDVIGGASIPVEGIRIVFCAFDLDGIGALNGISAGDDRLFFRINYRLQSTSASSIYSFAGNIIITTMLVNGTWYKLSGTTTSISSERFTNTTNKALYTAINKRTFEVTATLSGTGGNNDDYEFTIAVNGVVNTNFISRITTSSSGAASNVVVIGNVQLSTNDYIEIYGRRVTGLIGFTATSGLIRINEV